jgi:hypothetical protein
MSQARTGRIDHDREDQRQHHRSTEVGLDHNQRREKTSHNAAGNKRAPKVAFFTGSLLEKVGEENDQSEF